MIRLLIHDILHDVIFVAMTVRPDPAAGGVKIQKSGGTGFTALHLQLLVERGENLHVQNTHGQTAAKTRSDCAWRPQCRRVLVGVCCVLWMSWLWRTE